MGENHLRAGKDRIAGILSRKAVDKFVERYRGRGKKLIKNSIIKIFA